MRRGKCSLSAPCLGGAVRPGDWLFWATPCLAPEKRRKTWDKHDMGQGGPWAFGAWTWGRQVIVASCKVPEDMGVLQCHCSVPKCLAHSRSFLPPLLLPTHFPPPLSPFHDSSRPSHSRQPRKIRLARERERRLFPPIFRQHPPFFTPRPTLAQARFRPSHFIPSSAAQGQHTTTHQPEARLRLEHPLPTRYCSSAFSRTCGVEPSRIFLNFLEFLSEPTRTLL